MHPSSYKKMESFFRTYEPRLPAGPADKRRVLEIGSRSYEGQTSYRRLIGAARYDYTGLDLSHGANVDLVPAMPFVWDELADESFEACISGQSFEHNPYFWVTASEIARVLVPGGYLCLIAPGSGPVHRYPLDCWRFYPDAWSALCALVGLELVEAYWEPDSVAPLVEGGEWRDAMLVARKPDADSAVFAGAAERRVQLTAPFRTGFGTFEPVPYQAGPATEDYLRTVRRSASGAPLASLRKRISRRIYSDRDTALFDPGSADSTPNG
jgi:SAM-dependent methyltransferase